jgi:tetratricopeptide (TPR) repeat protein
MKTLDCISACPNDALSLGFGKIALGAKPKDDSKEARKAALKKRRGRYDLALWEELVAAGLMLWFFYASRGMLDAIPMLLAGGVAAICTMVVLLTLKLFHQPNVRLYKFQFKKQGRVRMSGVAIMLLGIAMVAGSAWSGNAKFLRWRGDMQFNQSLVPGDTLNRPEYDPSPEQYDRAMSAIESYQRADAPEMGGIGWKLNAEHRLRLAYFLSMVDRHAEAFEQLRLVIIEGEPTDALVLQAGQVLIRSMDDARGDANDGDHDEAKRVAILDLYTKAVQAHPRLHAIRGELAKSLAASGNPQGAERYWDIEWQSNRYRELAGQYESQGNASDAKEAHAIADRLEEFIEDSLTDPMFILAHASMHAFLGEMAEAQRLFELASDNTHESENPAGVHIDIGRTALQFGLVDLARAQADAAVALEDASVMTWVAAAEIASFSGQFDIGTQRIEHAQTMKRFDEQSMLMARAANATLRPDSMEMGRELLRQAVANTDDPFEAFTIARGMAAGGASLGAPDMLDEGLELIEGIIEAHPEHAIIRADLGDIYSQLGRWESARTHLVKAAELSASNPVLAQRAADMLEAMGRTDEARTWTEEAQRRRAGTNP